MTNVIPMPLQNIDMQLAEISAMVSALIFMQEEADAAKLAELKSATISMLYVVSDKLANANESSGLLHRREYYRRAG